MTTISIPAAFKPKTIKFTPKVNQRVAASPFGGSEQAVDLLNDRWLCSVSVDILTAAEGAQLEAFIAALRGMNNVVALHHYARPAPRGTVRGTLSLSVEALQGASSVVITGCSPSDGTLLMGDMLSVGGLLVMVASDCTASGGVITVPIVNRLRATKAAGASVVWDAPTALFRLLDTSGVEYETVVANATTFEFGEKI